MRNASHRFRYLNTWFLDGGTVWEGLDDVALPQEVIQCVCGGVHFEIV